jgi:D-alanyl-D-alanine carboxypeptidase
MAAIDANKAISARPSDWGDEPLRMKRALAKARSLFYLFFLPVAVSLFIHTNCANAFSWNAAKEHQALQLVKQFQALHQIPSVASGITVNGKTVLTSSIGDSGSIIPSGEDMRYHIGSVTKQITAAGILALIEDRTIVPSVNLPITLDTTLEEIFPHNDLHSNVGKITVRRLLTMTSNLPNYTDDPFAFSKDQSGKALASQPIHAGQIVQRLKTYDLVGPPLTFDYSNTNYFVLALIIQVLKGGYDPTPIPITRNYLRDRILAKAGMTKTSFVGESPADNFVDAAPNFLHPPQLDQGSWPKGAGDAISTVADMARWNNALMAGDIINESSLQIMFAPAAPVANSDLYRGCKYGMGWYVCDMPGHRLHQHDGVISGFMASNAIDRQENGSWMGITVLANTDATTDIVALIRSIIRVGTD